MSDPTRRHLLGLVSEEPRTTGELCASVRSLSRTAVLQHLSVLEEANLLISTREGRVRWNHINAAPLHAACGAWLDRHVRPLARSMVDLKRVAESQTNVTKEPTERRGPRAGRHPMEEGRAARPPLTAMTTEQTIEINAPRTRVWEALVDETSAWWSQDFYVTDSPKGVVIEPHVGGRWYENAGDGAGGLWGFIQTFDPPNRLEIVGALFPQWGGPATMHLTLELEEQGGGTILSVRDTLFGAVTEKLGEQTKDGWRALFADAFKTYVEG